jgi:F0F1-type ATP synthase assembly protein I
MAARQDKIRLRWYHLRRIQLTGEYVGGVLAGFGLGIWIMAAVFKSFADWPLIMLLGLLLVPIGQSIVMRAQDRYTTDDSKENMPQ